MAETNPVVEDIRAIFLGLARSLVDASDSVSLEVENDGTAILFRLSVARSDVGKVIGQQGRNARALRVLLNAAGVKHKLRLHLDITDYE